jgi:hypothetical protein
MRERSGLRGWRTFERKNKSRGANPPGRSDAATSFAPHRIAFVMSAPGGQRRPADRPGLQTDILVGDAWLLQTCMSSLLVHVSASDVASALICRLKFHETAKWLASFF